MPRPTPAANAAAAAAAALTAVLLASAPAAAVIELPFIIDQGGSTVATTDAGGFSAARLRAYGVKQAAAGSIDCTTYMSGVPGGPWYNASGMAMVAACLLYTSPSPRD